MVKRCRFPLPASRFPLGRLGRKFGVAIALAFGLSLHANAQDGFKPFRQPPQSLTPAQKAHIKKVHDFIWCLLWWCTTEAEDKFPPTAKLQIVADPNAGGGLLSYPDKVNNPGLPLQGGGAFTADTASSGAGGNGGNAVAIDPGAFTAPGPNGEVRFCPGCGPNVNGNGAPAGPPVGSNNAVMDLGETAAQIYGEFAHQDLVCTFAPGGGPATEVDAAALKASEARVYRRAATFFRWLVDCEWCWYASADPADIPKIRNFFDQKAQNYDAKAKDYGG
jgi:hypothetical protein